MVHIRVDLSNTNNKLIEFELANIDTFIIRVGFGLTNVDTIRTLTQNKHHPHQHKLSPLRWREKPKFRVSLFTIFKQL